MHVNGHLDFKGIGKLLRPGLVASDFPANPSVGEIILKDKKVYICVELVDGMPLWVCMVNEVSMYRHDQQVAALEWTIVHNLNTNYTIVQVYDNSGQQVIPDSINSGVANQVTVSFNMPVAGVAIISAGNLMGLPRENYAFTGNYSGQTWVVQHNLGYNPNVSVIVDGYVLQPESIVHNDVNQLTITFTSAQVGSVRCV